MLSCAALTSLRHVTVEGKAVTNSVLMTILLLFIPVGWAYLLIMCLLPPKDDDDQ